MRQLAATFKEFWSGFVDTKGRLAVTGAAARPPNAPIPAFQEGYARVPTDDTGTLDPPDYPLIVYPVVRPDFAKNALIQATVRDRTPANVGNMDLIYDVLGQVEKRIPHEGVILRLDDGSGAVWLQRGSPFFIFPPGHPRDKTIVRGVVNLVCRGYIA